MQMNPILSRLLSILIVTVSIANIAGCAATSTTATGSTNGKKLTTASVIWEDPAVIKVVFPNHNLNALPMSPIAREKAINYTVEQTKPILNILRSSVPLAIQDLLKKNAVSHGGDAQFVARPISLFSTSANPSVAIELALYEPGAKMPIWKTEVSGGPSIIDTQTTTAEKIKQGLLDAVIKAGFFNIPS